MKSAQLDRFTIFEKQQKGYNIISCYPKEMTSSLKVFPKLTLENKLIESGRYMVWSITHSLQKQSDIFLCLFFILLIFNLNAANDIKFYF